MRAQEFLSEGLNHPVICVDVQPEYAGFSSTNAAICEKIIQFVTNQTGPVLMFVNAEQEGMSADTVASIVQYWNETANGGDDLYDYDEEADEYTEKESPVNWNRFVIADKGYGWLRAWMDAKQYGIEISDAAIIKTIREMYQQRVSDSRMLFNSDADRFREWMGDWFEELMLDDGIQIMWASVAQLKKFSGAYLVGGGREECLREVELLMNAFNIRYRRIDSLVY